MQCFSELPFRKWKNGLKEICSSVGLLDAIDKMPAELSGGMKKRAGLARALMLKPEIMLYDEPTAGLDPFTAKEISDLIVTIQHEHGTASVIVTHDMKCAETVSDRICLLHDGKFIAEGDYKTLGALIRIIM